MASVIVFIFFLKTLTVTSHILNFVFLLISGVLQKNKTLERTDLNPPQSLKYVEGSVR